VLPIVSYGVVCISSQDGALAQEAALLVASGLGFRLIDEEIITRAAVEAGVDRGVVADVEKRKSRLMKLVEGLGAAGLSAGVGAGYMVPGLDAAGNVEPASDELMGLIRSVIEETAATGNAVIVAHAASLALGTRKDVLRVLVTASPQTREQRLANALSVDQNEASRALKRSDAARADYMKRFYGIGEELPTHYDLVLNTDKLAPEHAAELIVQAAGGRTDGERAGAAADA
jgi:cytidylate kinase